MYYLMALMLLSFFLGILGFWWVQLIFWPVAIWGIVYLDKHGRTG